MSKSPSIKATLFAIFNDLTSVYVDERKYEDAKHTANEALNLASEFPDPLKESFQSTIEINLGAIYLYSNEFDQAEKYFRLALVGRKHLAEFDPGAYQSDVAKILFNLSLVYHNTQRTNDERKMLVDSIDIYRTDVKHDKSAGFPLIGALEKIAELDSQIGLFDAAARALEEAKEIVPILPNLESNSRSALLQQLDMGIAAAMSFARARDGIEPKFDWPPTR